MEIPPELMGDIISCWMTVRRFSPQLDIPEMNLESFETLLTAIKPTLMCYKLHTTLLQHLIDSKLLDYKPEITMDEVTWPHHVALAIQAGEKLRPSRSPPQIQQEVLQRMLKLVYPNREKKPSEYYLQHALLDLVRVAQKLHGDSPLTEEVFSREVLAAIAPIDRRRPGDGILPSEYFEEQCESFKQGRSASSSALGVASEAFLKGDYDEVVLVHRVGVLLWLCNEVPP